MVDTPNYSKSPLANPAFFNTPVTPTGNYSNSPLANPDFLAEAAANERNYVDNRTDAEKIRDLETEKENLNNRSIDDVIGDAVTGVASTFTGLVGGAAGLVISGVGAGAQYLGEDGGDLDEFGRDARNYGIDYLATTDAVTGFIRSGESETKTENARINAEIGAIQSSENRAQYDRAIADGESEFIAGLARTGADFLDTAERVLSDPLATESMIIDTFGSLGPSASFAKAGVNLASRLASRMGIREGKGLAVAETVGSALATGAIEGSGTYSQTVGEVMGRSYDDMMTSPMFRELILNGVDPDEAQRQVADATGMDAFRINFPAAITAGLLSAKFNANPLGTFEGRGLMHGLREVGSQTLEEMAQGGASQIAQNLAIADRVDDRVLLSDDVGEQLALGAIGGAGMAGVIGAVPAVRGSIDLANEADAQARTERRQARREASYVLSSEQRGQQQDNDDVRMYNAALSRLDELDRAGKSNPARETEIDGETVVIPETEGRVLTSSELDEIKFLKDNLYNPDAIRQRYGIPEVEFETSSPGTELFNSVIGPVRNRASQVYEDLRKTVSDVSSSENITEAVSTVKTGIQAVKEVVAPIVSQVIKAGQDFTERGNPVIQNETVAAAESVSEAVKDPTVDTGTFGVTDAPVSAESVPDIFKNSVPESSNIADTMVGIVKTLAEKKIAISDMADDAILFVAQKFNEMQNAASTLPADIQKKIKKVLASPDLERIRKRAGRIDLNNDVSSTIAVVSSTVKKMTVAMSKLNPTNVNPDVVDRILKQEDRGDLTLEDIQDMETAASVSRPMNQLIKNIVKIEDDKNAFLVSSGQAPDKTENSFEAVSRRLIDGDKNDQEKMPSVRRSVNQIILGMRSPDKTVDVDGVRVPVANVISNFRNLVQHMTNKVNALNTSFDQNDEKGVGPKVNFESLSSKTRKFIPVGMAGSGTANYNKRSINSVTFAKTVGADAAMLGEVYNALVKAYPEAFPYGPVVIPAVKTDESQTAETPAVITQETTADESVPTPVGTDENAETTTTGFKPEDQKVLDSNPFDEIEGYKRLLQIAVDWFKANTADKTVEVFDSKGNKATFGFELNKYSGETQKVLVLLDGSFENYGNNDFSALSESRGNVTSKPEKILPYKKGVYENGPKKGEDLYSYSITANSVYAIAAFGAALNAKNTTPAETPETKAVENATPVAFETTDPKSDLKLTTLTQEIVDAMSDDEIMALVNDYDKGIQSVALEDDQVAEFMEKVAPLYEVLELPANIIRKLTLLKTNIKSHFGQAYWAEQVMSLTGDTIKSIMEENEDTFSLHVFFHELFHLIDGEASKTFGKTASMLQYDFDVGDGEIYDEVKKLSDSDPEWNRYFSYALSFRTPDEIASEIFAEIGPMIMFMGADEAFKLLPKGVAYVEKVIEQAGGAKAPKRDAAPSTEVVAQSIPEATESKVTDRFVSVFRPKKSDAKAKNAGEILAKIAEKPGTEVYREFATILLDRISTGMNKRLETVKFFKSAKNPDQRSVGQVFKEEQDRILAIRDYKALMIVDPATGQYDQRLLGLASMAVIDWLTTARAMGGGNLMDLIDELGIEADNLTNEQIRNLINSVPTRSTTEGLGKKILKLWNVQPDNQSQMVDIRGTTEGLVKEIFTVLSEMKDPLIKLIEIPVKDGTAASFEISALAEEQEAIGMEASGSLDKVLFPEDQIMASFGTKLIHVDKTQANRPDVPLSDMEQAAIKKIQDTAHIPALPVIDFFNELGLEVWGRMAGVKDSSKLVNKHPLTLTIEGKNTSIERDFTSAFDMVNAAYDPETEKMRSVFYPIGVTSVGRHQMKGVNPQNNKLLRALITPTHSKLDMVNNQKHKDGFWLTVAQSSGLAKVEKKLHKKILKDIREVFMNQYRDAVALAVDYLESSSLDAESFANAMLKGGKGEPVAVAQVNAVLAVARLIKAKRDGTLETFETTLSFELDGKTDGPANMMVAFGQGILTPMEYMNFKRVGFFLGSKFETLNSLFSDKDDGTKGEVDLYEVNSTIGTSQMLRLINKTDGDYKKRLMALQRFAGHFGDFQIMPDGSIVMSRATSKNPMTKKVYGSGEVGIADGISQDMLVGFYTQLTNIPEGSDVEQALNYPEINQDLSLLFGVTLGKSLNVNEFILPKDKMVPFAQLVKNIIGAIITESTKEVIGSKTIGVSDLLVYATNVQSEFMKLFFEQRLAEMMADRGVTVLRELSVDDYNAVVKETMAFAPYYRDGLQNLRIGDFSGQQDKTEMSSNLSGNIRAKSTMAKPDDLGVRVIPYVIQARGDAMMINRIFGAENAPERAIPIFDGIDMAIADFDSLSDQINEAVMANWDHDVLGPILDNMESFLGLIESQGLSDKLKKAFNIVFEKSKQKSSVVVFEVNDVVTQLREAVRLNQARKIVFKQITIAVDHMGGSGKAYIRNADGAELTLDEINTMIQAELDKTGSSEIIGDSNTPGSWTPIVVDTSTKSTVFPSQAIGKFETLLERIWSKDQIEVLKTSGIPELYPLLDEILRTIKKSYPTFTPRAGFVAFMGSDSHKAMVETILPRLSAEFAAKPKPVKEQLVVTDVGTVVDALIKETKKKHIREAVRAIKDMLPKDAQIIMGTSEEISQWRKENLDSNGVRKLNQTTKGYYDVKNNIIFIMSNNAETITHELIHMATFSAVVDHYTGVKKSNAVKNLEVLMAEFMEMDFSKAPKRAQQAYNAAKAQILKGKAEGSPMGDAVALNEFMAWTLSNDGLMKELKATPTSLVARLTKVAKTWIQRILGVVPLDMYSNILFNTEMVRNEEVPDGLDGSSTPPPPPGDNNDAGEVTPSANNFTNFWIDLLRDSLEESKTATGNEKQERLLRYISTATNALIKLDFGGFGLSEYQKKTFTAIHTVIAAELRLDSNALIAMGRIYEHITNNLSPQMFGSGQVAQDRYSAVMELMGATKNDEGISDSIAVLLALSQTSTAFRKAMEQIPQPAGTPGINTTSLNDVLTSTTGFLMQKMIASTDTEGKGVQAILDSLSDQILRQDDQNEFRALKGLMDTFSKADKFANGALSTLAQRAREVNIGIQNSNTNPYVKTVVGAVALATQFLDKNLSKQAAKGAKAATHMDRMLDGLVFIRELVSEIVGSDSVNTNVVQMLDKVNYVVQSARQAYREELPVIFQNEFDEAPTAEQQRDLYMVLGKGDFAALFDLSNPDEAFDLLNDQSLLDRKIKDKEKKILREFPGQMGTNILMKSQQLADFMNGKGAGFQLWKNAYAIHKLIGGKKPNLVADINALISLYALNGTDVAQRESVARMQASDPKGVHNLLVYVQALNKEEDQKVISEAARINGYKGFIPYHSKGETSLIIARDTEREDLERRGYVRVGDDTTEAGSLVSRGYYMSTVKQSGNYSQGVLQQVQDTYRGVNATTGLTVNGTVSGVISGVSVITITDALNNNLAVTDPKNVLIPVMDEEGDVLYYERALNPDMIEKYLQPEANMAMMVGAWAGRQVEEKFSHEYNKALVTELKRIWDNREPNTDGLFVRMDKDQSDKIYAESWKVIPPQLKEYIMGVFGEETGFMVPKSMINMALGYRDPSIVDVWTGNNRLPDAVVLAVKVAGKATMGDKAFQWLANIESFTMTTISTAKDLIVVRSLVVPLMNTQSNVFQLVNRGVGTKKIIKGYREKFVEIDKLNDNLKKIMGLQARIRLAATDKNQVAILKQQIQVLEDENNRFTVAPLVKAGAYKNISEGITDLDVSITTGKLGDWFDGQLSRLPTGVQTVAKYGLLSKDTALYRGANKAVQYGDFIAKSIYYDELTSQGMDHDTAMARVNEEFVNFSILPGRTRTYLESMGATWFLTFKIRSMKVALQMMRENPVRSLALVSGVGIENGVITDNAAGKFLEGTLPYSLGWDMLFDAPGMNPWIAVTSG